MHGIIAPREVFFVSIVISICGKNFCSMISDGRKIDPMPDLLNPILDESFPKVFKVNNRVVFGGTGMFSMKERILDPLNVYPVKDIITPKMAYKASVDYLQNQKFDLYVSRNYIIGGKDSKGKFSIREVHFDPVNHEVSTTIREPDSGFVISCALPARFEEMEGKILQVIGEFIQASKTHKQMLDYITKFIRGLYKFDDTIGGDIFEVTIT